jgi:hypothetical protein
MARMRAMTTAGPRAPSEALSCIVRGCTGGAYTGPGWRAGGRFSSLLTYAKSSRRWRGPWTETEIALARRLRVLYAMIDGEGHWYEILCAADEALKRYKVKE